MPGVLISVVSSYIIFSSENDMPPPPLPSAFRDLTPIGASPAPLEPDQAPDGQALVDDPSQALTANETQEKPTKKSKRVRLLLDKVTELSDDEMKVSFPLFSHIVSELELTPRLDCPRAICGGPEGLAARNGS